MMKPELLVAIAAFFLSILAFIFSIRNRRENIKREEDYQIRVRVWDILSTDAGSRSVASLDEDDGKTMARIKFLKRTANQLKLAGALGLGQQLDGILSEEWPDASPQLKTERDKYFKNVELFMNVSSKKNT